MVDSSILVGTYFEVRLHPYADVDVDLDVQPNASAYTDDNTNTCAYTTVDVSVNTDIPGIWGTLWLHTDNYTNTACITILSGWFIGASIDHKSEGYTMRN